jgi:hypothetical protein
MALTDRTQLTPGVYDVRRVAALAAGDLVAFNVVTAIGLLSHSRLTGLDALGEVVTVAAPFAIGWFLVAPFAGAFRADIAGQPRRILPRAALAWLIALPIGLLLWSLIRQKPVQPAFAVVTFSTNQIKLRGWRGGVAWLVARARGQEPRRRSIGRARAIGPRWIAACRPAGSSCSRCIAPFSATSAVSGPTRRPATRPRILAGC